MSMGKWHLEGGKKVLEFSVAMDIITMGNSTIKKK